MEQLENENSNTASVLLMIVGLSFAITLAAICVLRSAEAEDSTSSDFILRDPVVTTVGGDATSTNFEMLNAGNELIISESSSSNFKLHAGPLYFDEYAPLEKNWRWYDDESNETPVTPLANELVAPTNIEGSNPLKLRLTIRESGGVGKVGVKFRLQYSTVSDFSSGATFVEEPASCTGSSGWCYATGAGADNSVVSSTVLSDAGACSGGVGAGCGTHNTSGVSTSSFSQVAGTSTEFEFTIKSSGAAPNTVYFFRAYDASRDAAVLLDSGETYPSLSTEGVQLIFSVSGLPAGTSTQSVTTDVSSTPVSVPFGVLSFGADKKAAHRLTLTTNAGHGYQVLVADASGFLNETRDVSIPGVLGTNASPSGWASVCLTTSTGCYGYHTGDKVLSGNPTRFSADDSYATFSSTPEEIAYSATPVTDETTDMVFRVEATNQQAAGSYQGSVVYIAVPTF
jgi:hypothetical protein